MHPSEDDAKEGSGSSERGRLRLLVAYDGRTFQGWQSQAHRDTIQDRLEAAFTKLCGGQRVIVHGSGRTDAGVHARGQVAHADVPNLNRHHPELWSQVLNAHLPPEIRVMRSRAVSQEFHARFSARGKVYRYVIWNSAVMDPFRIGRVWHFPSPLDYETLHAAARLLVGTHDFAAFAANRGHSPGDTVRTIRRIDIRRVGRRLTLEYEGSGFLYKMVRLLTGSMIRCAQGRATLDWIGELLAGSAKSSFAAPADGLYLMRVLYKSPGPSN